MKNETRRRVIKAAWALIHAVDLEHQQCAGSEDCTRPTCVAAMDLRHVLREVPS